MRPPAVQQYGKLLTLIRKTVEVHPVPELITRSRVFYSPIHRLGLMKRTKLLAITALLSATLAQAADVFVPGVLQEEYWAGKVKGDIAAGTAGTPTFITNLTSFEIPVNVA